MSAAWWLMAGWLVGATQVTVAVAVKFKSGRWARVTPSDGGLAS